MAMNSVRIPALGWLLLTGMLVARGAEAQIERDRPDPPGAPPPATAFARLDEAGAAADHPGADWLIVLDASVNRITADGVAYVDLYQLTKILTEQGASTRSALEWGYDPRSSFVKIAEVNVLRDGARIPVPIADVKDLPAPQSAIYWSDRIKVLQLPRLKPGDGVEVLSMRKGYNYALLAEGGAGTAGAAAGGAPSPRYADAWNRIRTGEDDRYIPPMAGEYFDIVLMQAEVPIVEKSYTLVLPAAKRLQSREYNGPIYTRTSYDPDSTTTTWWVKDMPARPVEPRQPDEPDLSPKVVMTTAPDWEAKSKWFFDVNRNQFEVTDEIRAHVDRVLASAGLTRKSEPMKVAKALNHWVAQNIRYSGQTMGEGEGFTLHPSDMLMEYRSGVCKDIASMSITLLRAAGLDTYPAMTMAGSRIEDIPADQFNHCVVAWEQAPGKFVMLDPTWVPFNNDVWSKLETEQQYLVGHPQGVDLQEIRYSPPEESPMTVTHDAEMTADGTLSGRIRIEGRGASDSRLRRIVYQHRKRELHATVAAMLAPLSSAVRIVRVDHRREDDFTGDMWLEVVYEAPGFALPVGDALEFTAPAATAFKDHPVIFRAGSVNWEPERKTDVFLYYTQRFEVDERLRLPAGYQLEEPPDPVKVDATWASFESTVENGPRALRLHATTDVKRRQIPPDGYPDLVKALKALDDYAAAPLRAVKGGAR